MPLIHRIIAIHSSLLTSLGVLVGISIGLFALSIPLDLALRLGNLGNIPWLNEVIEYVLYAGIFLGAPWVLRQGAHVRVDLVSSSIPAGAARRLERGINLLGLGVSVLLCYYGILGMLDAYESNSIQRKTLNVADWYLLLIFVVSMGLVAIEFLLRLFHSGAEIEEERAAVDKAGY